FESCSSRSERRDHVHWNLAVCRCFQALCGPTGTPGGCDSALRKDSTVFLRGLGASADVNGIAGSKPKRLGKFHEKLITPLYGNDGAAGLLANGGMRRVTMLDS